MNKPSTKSCPYCAETISTEAKVCPRCRQWQTFRSFTNPVVFLSIVILVICALGIAAIIRLQRIIDPGPDFALFRNSLSVVESKIVFYEREKQTRLRTLVVLTNQSSYSWKDVEVEARYFDKEHRLIDAKTYQSTRGVILNHSELALEIESIPCRTESDYFSHEVYVRAARNSHSFP